MKRKIISMLMVMVILFATVDVRVFASETTMSGNEVQSVIEGVVNDEGGESTVSENNGEQDFIVNDKEIAGSETEIETESVENVASAVTASGQCGDNLTWTLENDKLIISGNGEMEDYYIINAGVPVTPWAKYKEDISELVIEEGVTSIGNLAFYNFSEIKGTLSLPDSLTKIGKKAFSGCKSLTGSIRIPNNLNEMGDECFSECSGFDGRLTFSNEIEILGKSVFRGCSGIREVVLPNNIKDIGEECFGNCTGIEKIVFLAEGYNNVDTTAFLGVTPQYCYFPLGYSTQYEQLRNQINAKWIAVNNISEIEKWEEKKDTEITFLDSISAPNVDSIPLSTVEELSKVTEGNYVLTQNLIIDEDTEWAGIEPTGTVVLDGQGYTIVNKREESLFGYVEYNCSVINLGYIQDNAKAEGMIECFERVGEKDNTEEYTLKLINCSVAGKSSKAGYISSVEAHSYGSNSAMALGNKYYAYCNVIISKCISSINIAATETDKTGGMIGEITSYASNGGRSYQYAHINVNISDSESNVQIVGSEWAGGYIGEIEQSSWGEGSVTINNSSVKGMIQGIYSGGFIGGEMCDTTMYAFSPRFINCEALAKTSQWDSEMGGNYIGIIDKSTVSFQGINYYDNYFAPIFSGKTDSNVSGYDTIFHIRDKDSINISDSAPTIWFTFETDKELEYTDVMGYNHSQFNMDISALCMILLDNGDSTYENVAVIIELPEGLSFSAETEERSIQKNLGTMSLSGTKRQDMSFTVYIDETVIKNEFPVDIKLTADGYETPQTNTYKIPVSIVVEKADETIVDTVERYTSDKEVQEVLEIFSNSSSDEELRQHLFEYYNYDNMLDVRERIIELGDMHDERWDYEGLIRDDMYLSWQYYDYLNNTPKGAAARVALYASGLVFNGEINDWIDPSTYLDSELPGIKKYKSMLEEFIQTESSTIEYYSYVKEVESFLNSTVGIWSATEKADIIKKLKEAPDGKSCKSYFNDFVAMKIGSGKDSMTLVFDGEKPKFMEAMGITDTVFDVVNISLDGITGLVDVSSNLEIYETYHGFLKEIYEADDLPWELVVAAYQLDQELGQAYWTPIKGILNEIRDKCLGEAFDAAGFENLLNKNGWLSAINFSAFCINQFVDVGAMVVNSCHTEGYAFLAMHYKNKLEQCKQQFIANKSEENAWAFYEAYVMLWKLRTAGEKKFLQMSKLEGNKVIDGLYEATKGETLGGMISELCGYSDKEAAVNDNLKMLEGFAFKYSIKNENLPDEYKYLQKIVIECPVNVEILTSDGTQVCVLNDGVETEITNEHGTFVSFYRATTGDYAKIAYFNSDAPYVIRAIGQDTGEVTYSFARTEDHQTYTVAGFDKVNISEKDIINITTNEEKYIVDEGGDGTNDIEGEQADKSKIFVQFDYQDGKQIRVAYADADGMITLPEVPAREGYEFKGWFEDSAGLENEFTRDTIVSKSITVYAKWESKEVKILSTPTANIVSGSVVEKGTEITLTCSVEGAQICYTLDGTIPTKESIKYNVPIIINQDITINAIATKDGYQNSEVASFNYTVKDDTDKDIGEVIPDDIPSDGIIPDGIWCAGITDMTYTSSSIKQSFRVYDGMKLLKEKTDYTITYKNNKNAYTYMDEDYTAFEEKLQNTGKRVKTGTFDPGRAPQVTIKMKGNYSGSQTIYYKIEKMDITGDDFVTENLTVTYTGKKQTPVPTLTWNGKKLKYGTDFYIPEYDNAKKDKTAFSASQTYALTVAGKGNYTGEIPITLTISASSKQIAINKITVKGIKSQTWKGEQIKPAGFTASYQKDVLSEENGDYIISFGENTAVGTGTVTFTGTGLDTDGDGYSYIGSKTVSFKITGTAMSKVTVNGVGKSYTYTGNAIEPVAELTYKANKNSDPVPLTENTHYTVTYQKNMDKGTATIIFTGMESGGYTGTKKVTFKIVTDNIADKKVGDVTVEQIDVAFKDTENVQNDIYVAPYMKGGAQPEIIVTDGNWVLEPGKDYTVSYSNNKKVALSTDKKAPTITIKGKGNYSGSKNVYFTIAAKALSNENGITVVAKDKAASTKKNGYRQSFKVYDADGKTLGSSDYDSKNVIYTLIQTENADGTVNAVEEVLDKNSVVPANSVIQITVQGKGIYAGGEATGTYRILENGYDISKATIQVQDQTYTGKQVTITEQSQFKTGKVYIKIGKETRVLTLGEDIEVVPGSYEKNINKGTAKVTFRGINDFGGTKTVSFKIGTRSIADFWQGIYKKLTGLFD